MKFSDLRVGDKFAFLPMEATGFIQSDRVCMKVGPRVGSIQFAFDSAHYGFVETDGPNVGIIFMAVSDDSEVERFGYWKGL